MLSFKHSHTLLTLVFAVAMLCFWVFPHVSLLLWHEQYQLFLWSADYLAERLAQPGGFAAWVAEFCVQFNYVYVVGALLLTAWFVALQRLVWFHCRAFGAEEAGFTLSFLPPLALWALMSDVSVLPCLAVSLAVSLASSAVWLRLGVRLAGVVRLVASLVMTLVVYWLAGPAVFAFAVLVAAREWRGGRLRAVAVLLLAPLAVGGSCFLSGYPVWRLFAGLFYYRYPEYAPTLQSLIIALTALLPLAFKLRAVRAVPRAAWLVVAVALAVGSFVGLRNLYGGIVHDLVEYDYLVRTRQWDSVLEKGRTQVSPTPLTVACVNLALSRKGELADNIFHYYQNGPEGLIPSFSRDMLAPVITAEVFYRLGMVNDCERFMFEAQQAIPDFRRSGRLTRRIVDCEIVNGNYAIARKHLLQLRMSLFYKSYAESRLAMLGDEAAIDADPEYGPLRRMRHKGDDFLFSDSEMDQMLGLLFSGCRENRMAYEYLVCHALLSRDIAKFKLYYPLGKLAGYRAIPRAFQEVLVGLYLQEHHDLNGMPYSVGAAAVQGTVAFLRAYLANPVNPELSQPPLSGNAWHYILSAQRQ